MKKITKAIFLILLLVIITIATAASVILKPNKTSVISIKNPEFLIDSFGNFSFNVYTDKDQYNSSEEVIINAVIGNTEEFNNSIFCKGWKNSSTGERYNPFTFYVYNEDNTNEGSFIWVDDLYPDNETRHVFIGMTDYNITLKAKQNVIATYRWNQTYEQNNEWIQIPTGKYFIVSTLDITWEKYYGDGNSFPMKKFGSFKTINIEG